MSEILQLENVHKWAGEGGSKIEILRGITLSVQAGEFLSIMGPSGSGKSTLLNLIGLLDLPSQGSIRLMGQDVANLNADGLAELRSHAIGFIFQSFNLLPYFTAKQNVMLPLSYTRRPHAEERTDELLAQVGLSHRQGAYPGTLSGGERQRVAIARSLANQPAFVLADEPTGALDSVTGAQIIELLSQLHRQGTTIVLVTHDETIARRAERILMMRDGQFE